MGLIIPFLAFGVVTGALLIMGIREKRAHQKRESIHPRKAA